MSVLYQFSCLPSLLPYLSNYYLTFSRWLWFLVHKKRRHRQKIPSRSHLTPRSLPAWQPAFHGFLSLDRCPSSPERSFPPGSIAFPRLVPSLYWPFLLRLLRRPGVFHLEEEKSSIYLKFSDLALPPLQARTLDQLSILLCTHVPSIPQFRP